MNKILKYARNKKYLVYVGIVISVISSLSSILLPLYIGEMIDNISNKDILVNKIIIFIILVFIATLTYYILSLILNKLAYTIIFNIRQEIQEYISKLDIKDIDSINSGNIISMVVNDVEYISNTLVNSLIILLNNIFTIIFTIVIILYINYLVGIVIILFSVISLFVMKFMSKSIRKTYYKNSINNAKMYDYLDDVVSKYKSIKIMNNQMKVEDEFESINKEVHESLYKANIANALLNPTSRIINNLIYVIVGLLCAYLVVDKQLTLGLMISLLSYAISFGKPFNEIATSIGNFSSCFSSIVRIEEFMVKDVEIENKEVFNYINGEILFNDVSFSYDDKKEVIHDLSLYIEGNSKIAIVGESGCGKTTLIKLLAGFYKLNKGNIYIDKQDISKINKSSLYKNIGLLTQECVVFKDSIYNNLTYGLIDIDVDSVIDICKSIQIHEFINNLKDGYDTIIDESIRMSKGQKQLINIARVMIANPSIIILDEATSSLDVKSEKLIQNALYELTKNKTSIMVAHRLSTIVNADLIVVMDKGIIVEVGNHNELLKEKGYYYELYTGRK